jgi:hypothetical protein
LSNEDSCLDHFGQFVRLRCGSTACGHVGWYKHEELERPAVSLPDPTGTGEVWVHDALLGISFKDIVEQH